MPITHEPAAQRVFITGASSGIGQALAKYYAAQGATLGLLARRGEQLQALAETLQLEHYAIYPADVRDVNAMQTAAHDFIQRFGAPNIVIANAGVSRGTLTEFQEDIAAFQAVIDINVMGMVWTSPNLVVS